MTAWVAMAVVGSLGALARYRLATLWPLFGIFVVNLSGAFVLGVLVGAGVHGAALMICGTGFLGAYTTFSTLMVERHQFLRSLALGLLVAWLGWLLGGAI